MKQILEQIFSRIRLVHSGLDDSSITDSSDDALRKLTRFITEKGFDTSLGPRLAALLRLSDDKTIYDEYDLQTIEELYNVLLSVQPNNLDLYLEAAHFADAVLDEPTKAVAIIEKALLLIEKKSDELISLKKSINED